MYEFTFTNSLGESLYFAYGTDYVLETVSGLSNVGTIIQSEKSPFQDGSTFIDSLLNTRIVTFIVQIRENIESNRRKAIRVLNPKLKEGTLSFTKNGVTRTLTCVVNEGPDMLENNNDRRPNLQRFTFTLEAHQPYFEGEQEQWTLAGFLGGLEFPFSFPITFGTVGSTITLNNDGDTTLPLYIELNGPLTNPTLTNQTTGEFIKLSQELLSGYKLEINTAFGKKSVVIVDNLGNRSNGFGYISPDSTLFGLSVGYNTLSYTDDVQPNKTAVSLFYKKRYIGV